jgi:hypothetical protein
MGEGITELGEVTTVTASQFVNIKERIPIDSDR